MTEVLFNLIYATLPGKWNLQIESIRNALSWFFAYDRQKYGRYLTAHYYNILLIKDSHPEIYRESKNGNFSVQFSFSRMEIDTVFETTINKDKKAFEGLQGL